MGRKQKLRQEKRDIKNNAAAAEAEAEVTATSDAIAEETADAIEDAVMDDKVTKIEVLEGQFPKSDMYVQAMADIHNINASEQLWLFIQGATKHGCVHSMTSLGVYI
jgi:Ca2+-dependent lipid-binding protein